MLQKLDQRNKILDQIEFGVSAEYYNKVRRRILQQSSPKTATYQFSDISVFAAILQRPEPKKYIV